MKRQTTELKNIIKQGFYLEVHKFSVKNVTRYFQKKM